MPAYPKTVAEAVDRLLNELTEENIEKIRHMKKEDLNKLHFGLGMRIRNNFGLWQENSELLNDCGKIWWDSQPDCTPKQRELMAKKQFYFIHVDDASGVIIQALWERLQVSSS